MTSELDDTTLFDEVLEVFRSTGHTVRVEEHDGDRQAWLTVTNKATGVTQRYHLWQTAGDPFYDLSLTMDILKPGEEDERDDRFPSLMLMNPKVGDDVGDIMETWARITMRRMARMYHRK